MRNTGDIHWIMGKCYVGPQMVRVAKTEKAALSRALRFLTDRTGEVFPYLELMDATGYKSAEGAREGIKDAVKHSEEYDLVHNPRDLMLIRRAI